MDVQHVIDPLPIVEHHLRVEVLQGIPHHQVGVVPGGHGAGPAQAIAARRLDRRHLYGRDGTDAHADGLADAIVDVSLPDDVLDVAVIGAEAEALRVGVVFHDSPDDLLEVPGGAALADMADDAHGGLPHDVFVGGALVVRGDAGQRVGRQFLLGKPGGVAILHLAVKDFKLGVHLGIAFDHRAGIHHLAESQDPVIVHIVLHIPRREPKTVVVQWCRGNAGGDHDIDMGRGILRLVQYVIDPVPAGDVRRLMGIDDKRRRAAPGRLRDQDLGVDHGGFQMQVRVDKPAGDVLAADVQLLLALIIADAHDHAVLDRDISPLDAVRKDIDDAGILQNKVRFDQLPCRL